MTFKSNEPQVFERPADVRVLKEYLSSLHGRPIITFEETTTAHWLYLELVDSVDRIVICDPCQNRLLCHGPKTDKIDAVKLCQLLRSGLLKEVYHSSHVLYELRCLVSAYEDVVRAGVRVQNQKSAVERGYGARSLSAPFILEHLSKDIELYEQSKEHYEAKFRELGRANPDIKILMGVAGIGVINAVKIVACVVEAHRFPYSGKYLSYCGLVKHEKISGQRSYGRRKARYNHMLKSVYKTAAMVAIRGNNPMRDYYQYLLDKGTAEHNARHAVARYIARVTYGVLKEGKPYDPNRWRTRALTRHAA
jgi:transposase